MKNIVFAIILILCQQAFASQQMTLFDKSRNRHIPLAISFPAIKCSRIDLCPVALLSSGYGVNPAHYNFLVAALNKAGYLTVMIQHELPQDPPLAMTGNLQLTRVENWQRGANTLNFVHNRLKHHLPSYNFDAVTLIGHSNGGDLSAWLAQQKPQYLKILVTLDNRRAVLPRHPQLPVLSLRAVDFPADKNVLPAPEAQKNSSICIVSIPTARHDDMTDQGPDWLKHTIADTLTTFLITQSCPSVKK